MHTCQHCKTEPCIKSHIFPKCLAKLIQPKGVKKTFIFIPGKEYAGKKQYLFGVPEQGFYVNDILCKKCDGRFSSAENQFKALYLNLYSEKTKEYFDESAPVMIPLPYKLDEGRNL